MPIPESQLDTWCSPGAVVTSARAYASIRAAIEHHSAGLTYPNPEIYLQGSYGNSTNIYADSDVDVVVQHNLSWGRNISALPLVQQQRYNQNVGTATYATTEFRADVLRALQRYFGSPAVDPGKKAIKVTVPNGRTVDVIPATEYRNYRHFNGPYDQSYVSGIKFEDSSGRIVINYPKEHSKNGEAKNSATRTNGRYKQTIRMFKNARNCAVERGYLRNGLAPSYFVECLLYNVPDAMFVSRRHVTFENIWNYLNATIQPHSAVCQNGQILLFGIGSEQWTQESPRALLAGLQNLWNNW